MVKTGVAFSDNIFQEPGHKKSSFRDPHSGRRMRAGLLLVFLCVGAFILFLKLVLVQVIQGYYYRNLSDNNRVKTILIHAPRGVIFDRNKTPLVYNIPGFRQIDNKKTKLLTQDAALALIAGGKKDLEVDSLRQYPYKDAAAHVLGYLGQISPEELKQTAFSDYNPGDLVGEMGLEREYEGILRGTDGRQLVEIDSMGKPIRKLGQTDPIPGRDIQTTLDGRLQKAAYLAMAGVKKGAVIVSTPQGEILAMVSKPTFDPNLFTLGQSYKTASASSYKDISSILLDGQSQPILNRAISGTYPPGSTFKIVNASAGLADNIIDENFKVNDTGVLKVGTFSFANWYFTDYGRTEGMVDVVKALKRSNDIFFYQLADKIGVNKLSEMGARFGIGKALGIDLAGEGKGILPTTQWKEKIIGEPWFLGDTYHYGIGQGYVLSTPLQVNAWAQTIATQGTLYRPHILKDIGDQALSKDFLNDKTIGLVRQGMIEACQPGGVAWPFFDFKIKNPKLDVDGRDILKVASASADMRGVSIACKTGTAEHAPKEDPHAWITLFAPAYKPQIVVTVLSESSGQGSNVAAPIAKKILEDWFSR